MKLSVYWHVFFIKYVITVILRDEVVKCYCIRYSIDVILEAHALNDTARGAGSNVRRRGQPFEKRTSLF